jgi:hypothetical protein
MKTGLFFTKYKFLSVYFEIEFNRVFIYKKDKCSVNRIFQTLLYK